MDDPVSAKFQMIILILNTLICREVYGELNSPPPRLTVVVIFAESDFDFYLFNTVNMLKGLRCSSEAAFTVLNRNTREL